MSQPSEPRPGKRMMRIPGTLQEHFENVGCKHWGCIPASSPSTHGGDIAPESTEESPKKEGKK